MFLAQASLEWRSVLRGACRRHAQRCGDRGLHHQLASVISCGSLSVHHFLASPAKPACVARRYRLGFLALDDALDPGGVRNPAQRFALQAEVMQVKGAKPLAQPPPEHLHGVQVGAFGRYPLQHDLLRAVGSEAVLGSEEGFTIAEDGPRSCLSPGIERAQSLCEPAVPNSLAPILGVCLFAAEVPQDWGEAVCHGRCPHGHMKFAYVRVPEDLRALRFTRPRLIQ